MLHNFWKTQPVPSTQTKFGDNADHNPFWKTQPILNSTDDTNGPVVLFKPEDIRREPLDLPDGYEWVEFDVQKDVQLICEFLYEYYSTDPDNNFRLKYSPDMIRWALCPPNFKKEWHIGVRKKKDNQTLVGMITATPSRAIIHNKCVELVVINFLCVRPNFRHKQLAPLLIKEISRRVAECSIWHAIYTSSLQLPHVVAKSRYYHRPLNTKKLIQVGFCHKHPKLTMSGTIKYYKLPDIITTKGLREILETDMGDACKVLNKHLAKKRIATSFTEDEFRYYFTPRKDVIYSYVVENNQGIVTEFVSFYSLPSTVIKSDKKDAINAAYMYYNTSETLIGDVLIIARDMGFDVFNCLNIMDITHHKFSPGNGESHYYLYNWCCDPVRSDDVGIVLV